MVPCVKEPPGNSAWDSGAIGYTASIHRLVNRTKASEARVSLNLDSLNCQIPSQKVAKADQ